MSAVGDETRALTVENILHKPLGITDREKNFLFNYIKEGDLPDKQRVVSNDPSMNIKITKESVADYTT